jgi:hypothetical protein
MRPNSSTAAREPDTGTTASLDLNPRAMVNLISDGDRFDAELARG